MTSWTEIKVLYQRELRSALRERTIVVNSIFMPVFLYPFMLWLMFSGITFVIGLQEGFVSRVALMDVPEAHSELRDSLEADEGVELTEAPADVQEGVERIRGGDLDALVRFEAARTEGSALADNFNVRIAYDRSEDRSQTAQERVSSLVERYRERWLAGEAEGLGVTADELTQFEIRSNNVATEREMGAFLLAEMIPLFLVIMVALGCFVPAIDSTAGERERHTWETTMSVAASRTSVVVAKYLYVATLGTVAGILNVVAVTVSLGPIFQSTLGATEGNFEFTIQAQAIPVMILGAVVLALFFAAAMMILASFARSFKDGQAMVTPVYWLAILPVLLGDDPDRRLTAATAAIPVVNVAGMARDAILGTYQPALIALTLGVGLVTVVLCLTFARWVLQFEDYLLGEFDGSVFKFVKDRMSGGKEKRAT